MPHSARTAPWLAAAVLLAGCGGTGDWDAPDAPLTAPQAQIVLRVEGMT